MPTSSEGAKSFDFWLTIGGMLLGALAIAGVLNLWIGLFAFFATLSRLLWLVLSSRSASTRSYLLAIASFGIVGFVLFYQKYDDDRTPVRISPDRFNLSLWGLPTKTTVTLFNSGNEPKYSIVWSVRILNRRVKAAAVGIALPTRNPSAPSGSGMSSDFFAFDAVCSGSEAIVGQLYMLGAKESRSFVISGVEGADHPAEASVESIQDRPYSAVQGNPKFGFAYPMAVPDCAKPPYGLFRGKRAVYVSK